LGKEVTVKQAVAEADGVIGRRFAEQPLVEASVRQVLGTTYRGLGELEKARGHLERALAVRREHLGPADRETLTTLGVRAQVVRDQNHDAFVNGLTQTGGKEVKALVERTLEAQRRALGEDDPLTLTTLHTLANTEHNLAAEEGRLTPEALALHERVLAARRRV